MKPEAQTEALPQAIEIEKDGATTRLFNAVTGKQIEGDIKVKLDFTSGKDCKATLSFEVAVTDIRVLEKQLAFFGEDNGTSSTPPYSVSLEAPIALMSKKAPNKAAR
jgi:hypothetical protein